jgi:hypothetical protein
MITSGTLIFLGFGFLSSWDISFALQNFIKILALCVIITGLLDLRSQTAEALISYFMQRRWNKTFKNKN